MVITLNSYVLPADYISAFELATPLYVANLYPP